jgi:hypothetical protein
MEAFEISKNDIPYHVAFLHRVQIANIYNKGAITVYIDTHKLLKGMGILRDDCKYKFVIESEGI